jgi:hypothetical protein
MKRNVLKLAFGSILLIAFLTACDNGIFGVKGNGNIVSQEITAADFDGIIANGIGNINIYPAENYKVVVITDSNIQEMIGIESKNNILYIENKSGNYNPTKLTIDVYMPELKYISSEGTGNSKIYSGSIQNLEINISGTGNIDALNYQAEIINLTLSGTGNAAIRASNALTGKISGTGNVDAQNYQVQTADLTLSGTGSAKIWVINTLTGKISGTGNILYKGNPIINVNVTGTGKVKPL